MAMPGGGAAGNMMKYLSKAFAFVGKIFGPPPGPSPLHRSGMDDTSFRTRPQGRSPATAPADERSAPPARTDLGRFSLQRGAALSDTISGGGSRWARELALLLAAAQVKGEQSEGTDGAAETTSDEARRATSSLIGTVFQLLESYAAAFNEHVHHAPYCITVTGPSDVKEDSQEASPASQHQQRRTYTRCRASSSSWSLSVRGRGGLVEFFLLPVNEIMRLSQAESPARLKLRLELKARGADWYWASEGLPVDSNEMRSLTRRLFKELALSSTRGEGDEEFDLSELPSDLEGARLNEAVRQLVMERQNLVQKIVTQHEQIQNSIARDLHDAVISDIMLLKRSLSGDKGLSDEEALAVLDRVTRQLREICHDLSPRDLKDWGLQTVVEDLLHRVSERTRADIQLSCDSDLPDLPDAVQLHIYRIIQESLSNIEKYAEASRVSIAMDSRQGIFRLKIEDNGKGFDITDTGSRRSREGGSGMGSIRERAELIRCFFPARLTVESQPHKGSTTTLEIKLSGRAPSTAFDQSL